MKRYQNMIDCVIRYVEETVTLLIFFLALCCNFPRYLYEWLGATMYSWRTWYLNMFYKLLKQLFHVSSIIRTILSNFLNRITQMHTKLHIQYLEQYFNWLRWGLKVTWWCIAQCHKSLWKSCQNKISCLQYFDRWRQKIE